MWACRALDILVSDAADSCTAALPQALTPRAIPPVLQKYLEETFDKKGKRIKAREVALDKLPPVTCPLPTAVPVAFASGFQKRNPPQDAGALLPVAEGAFLRSGFDHLADGFERATCPVTTMYQYTFRQLAGERANHVDKLYGSSPGDLQRALAEVERAMRDAETPSEMPKGVCRAGTCRTRTPPHS